MSSEVPISRRDPICKQFKSKMNQQTKPLGPKLLGKYRYQMLNPEDAWHLYWKNSAYLCFLAIPGFLSCISTYVVTARDHVEINIWLADIQLEGYLNHLDEHVGGSDFLAEPRTIRW